MIRAETRDLRLLAALAASGTLHAAARQLHVSPSALSQQLRALEEGVGGKLFERRAQRLAATPAGQHFTAGARALLAELERLEREVQTLLAGATATIRLAMSCHQSYRWLPRVLARFAELEPRVDVTLVVEAAASPFEWLLERRLDVALVTGKQRRDRRLRARRIFRDELVAVVGTAHPWARRRWVEAGNFADEQLFADARALDAREPLGAALARARVSPRKLTQVPMTGSVALDLVRAGLGVTLFPRWTVQDQLRAGDLAMARIGKRGLWLDWFLATRREPADVPLESFLALLRSLHPLSEV
jgi:LysR family transcriptional regulator for metE and metH